MFTDLHDSGILDSREESLNWNSSLVYFDTDAEGVLLADIPELPVQLYP